MVSLMMQSFFTIITLLRKVREYVVSTLLTLKKLKINNTALTIPCKALNILFLSQITTTMPLELHGHRLYGEKMRSLES